VETVPTPGKIPHQNRCFFKIPVLTGKKPCTLEGFEKAQKWDDLQPVPEPDATRRVNSAEK
jgi:hypothetical protein